MTKPRHLVTVWNPSYADDPLDAHLRRLLGWAERHARGECDEEHLEALLVRRIEAESDPTFRGAAWQIADAAQ